MLIVSHTSHARNSNGTLSSLTTTTDGLCWLPLFFASSTSLLVSLLQERVEEKSWTMISSRRTLEMSTKRPLAKRSEKVDTQTWEVEDTLWHQVTRAGWSSTRDREFTKTSLSGSCKSLSASWFQDCNSQSSLLLLVASTFWQGLVTVSPISRHQLLEWSSYHSSCFLNLVFHFWQLCHALC